MRTKKNFIKKRNLGLFISYAELEKYHKSTYGYQDRYCGNKKFYKMVRLKYNNKRGISVVKFGDLC